MAVTRIWHGWTTSENVDAYERPLHGEVFPGVEAKEIPGYRGIRLLRHERVAEVEFVTAMTFDSIDSVIAFQGRDYEQRYVPAAAQKLLVRLDQTPACSCSEWRPTPMVAAATRAVWSRAPR